MVSPSTPAYAEAAGVADPAAVVVNFDSVPVPPVHTPACSTEELQKLCDTLSLQYGEAKRERDEYARQLSAMPRSSVEAEKALFSIRQARDTLLARNHELLGQITEAEHRHAELQNTHDDLTSAHTATLREVESLRKEADELRRKALELSEQKNAHLESERAYISAVAESGRQLAVMVEERDDALTRAAQLEARLQQAAPAGDSATTDLRQQIAALIADRDALRGQFAGERAALLAQLAAAQAADDAEAEDASAEARPQARGDRSFPALRKRLAALQIEPANPETIEALATRLLAFAESHEATGGVATARLASATADFAQWLRKVPAKVPSALGTLEEAFALIEQLAAIKKPAPHLDPSGAFVYTVDDDPDNCECVSMALEKVALRTKYAVNPEAALADLTAGRCDLVVLDVDMPRMDGFELHARIRALPHHRMTPIIFLSGHMSTAERVAALGPGANRFIAKPYNLNDLSLKALAMVVQARLGT